MGYMRHNSIIVSGCIYKYIKDAYEKAIEIFPEVSNLLHSDVNGYRSFFIPPDGSKEGWYGSNLGDDKRHRFIEWLKGQNYEDGSSPFSWVEVQYGDDNKETKIINHSDEL
jgi:hypothetical protein